MSTITIQFPKFLRSMETRCVVCGRRTVMYLEKTCPRCGKRSVVRADALRCGSCHAKFLQGGDKVCPLCGGKQRTVVELRGLKPENLTAFAHLLHEGQPTVSLKDCRKQCKTITWENPYRLSMSRKPERIRPFIQAWNALGGTAAACLPRETSRRPVVQIRSYNTLRTREHARLLFEAVQKTDRAPMTLGGTMEMLHSVHQAEKPVALCFQSDFDHIDAWIAEWKKLGGTAVRSREYR